VTAIDDACRFWPLQWIEAGWLLALSALLIAATVWLVRRRAAYTAATGPRSVGAAGL
jgi:hypothetical protein